MVDHYLDTGLHVQNICAAFIPFLTLNALDFTAVIWNFWRRRVRAVLEKEGQRSCDFVDSIDSLISRG